MDGLFFCTTVKSISLCHSVNVNIVKIKVALGLRVVSWREATLFFY